MIFNEDLTPVDIAYRSQRIRRWFIALTLALIAFGCIYWRIYVPIPVDYKSDLDHFKYGSIGSDTRYSGGIPFRVWQVLPSLFPEYLPNQGEQYLAIPSNQRHYLDGYASFGFLVEPSFKTPIGFSLRRDGVNLIGLNCAVCHTSTVQVNDSQLAKIYGPDSLPNVIGTGNTKRAIIPGMPANTVDLGAYFTFLFRCAEDERFTADIIMAAIKDQEEANGKTGVIERIGIERSITRLRKTLLLRKQQLHYLALLPHGADEASMPRFGPGRVDTFTPYKSIQFSFPWDGTSGIADFPSIWNQRPRDGMQLHWDGNNVSVFERNISASLGAGATPNSLDMHRMLRVAKWIGSPPPPNKAHGGIENESTQAVKARQSAARLNPVPKTGELPIPNYPFSVDRDLAKAGKLVFNTNCASCHGWNGPYVGKVEPISSIGTDPARFDSYTEEFRANQMQLGVGKWWQFKKFVKTEGYANAPLDGVWARAPYLHNGSVPTIRDLLNPKCSTSELQKLGIKDQSSFEKIIRSKNGVKELIEKARNMNRRPPVFYRGDDQYDPANLGFRCDREISDDGRRLFLFSTLRFGKNGPAVDILGNGNQGHGGKGYGGDLQAKEREALLEYLKLIDDSEISSN